MRFVLLAIFTVFVLSTADRSNSSNAAEDVVQSIDTPVKVFILMGQSNMLGEGAVILGTTNGTLEFAVKTEHKYPYLVDKKTDNWIYSENVRNVFVMGSGGVNASVTLQHNDWLGVNVSKKKTIGPELGIGFTFDEGRTSSSIGPVMILKSCIGDRALGWDLLPPKSPSFDFTDAENNTWTYAGYHQSPSRWKKGTVPVPINWEAGLQYDGDVARATNVLSELSTYYPGAGTKYEVAGFFWWQGDRDSRDVALAQHYEENLVRLIKALRMQFNAPDAKFVTASLGQTINGSTAPDGLILDAMLNVDGESGKYPEFKGNVAAVYTHPLSMGSSSGAHYGGNAETYMNVGEAMGEAMLGLINGDARP